MMYRLRTRTALTEPWSNCVSTAPLAMLLRACKRAAETARFVRLEVHGQEECGVSSWHLVVDVDAGAEPGDKRL